MNKFNLEILIININYWAILAEQSSSDGTKISGSLIELSDLMLQKKKESNLFLILISGIHWRSNALLKHHFSPAFYEKNNYPFTIFF